MNKKNQVHFYIYLDSGEIIQHNEVVDTQGFASEIIKNSNTYKRMFADCDYLIVSAEDNDGQNCTTRIISIKRIAMIEAKYSAI